MPPQDVMTDSSPDMVTLIKGVIRDAETLTQQQLKLFREELKEEGKELRDGTIALVLSFGAFLVGGVLIGIGLASVLVSALNLPAWVGYGLVGLLVAGLGAGLFFFGTKEIKSATPIADESMKALEENVECLTNPSNCPTPSKR